MSLLLIGAAASLLLGCRTGSFEMAHSGAYSGWVLDARTKAPVAAAKVELLSTLQATSESDNAGYFHIGPLKCSHCGVAFSPEATTFHCEHSVGINLLLKVSKTGYEPGEFLVPAHYEVTNWNKGADLNVGHILLKPLSEPPQ